MDDKLIDEITEEILTIKEKLPKGKAYEFICACDNAKAKAVNKINATMLKQSVQGAMANFLNTINRG